MSIRSGCLLLVPALLGCVSDEALRRVALTTDRPAPSCAFVAEDLEGKGSDREAAERDLRQRAARSGANLVVLKKTHEEFNPVAAAWAAPWSYGNVVIANGDAYRCVSGVATPAAAD